MKLALVLTALAVGIALLIAWASLVQPGSPSQPDWAEFASKLVATNDVVSAEDIPLYPDVRQVEKRDHPLQKLYPITYFATDASSFDVIAFYETVLPKKGWKLIESYRFVRVEFLWSDPKGKLPWCSNLKIMLQPGTPGPNGDNSRTRVEMHLLRLPDATNIPVYPGAMDIKVEDIVDEYDAIDRIITFVTSDSPTEVEAYYNHNMPKYGWGTGWDSLKPLDSISEGLVFGFDVGGPEASAWGRATVSATHSTGVETLVKIVAEGTDLPKQPR